MIDGPWELRLRHRALLTEPCCRGNARLESGEACGYGFKCVAEAALTFLGRGPLFSVGEYDHESYEALWDMKGRACSTLPNSEPQARGWCGDCFQQHALPFEPAVGPAEILQSQLEGSGCLDFALSPEQRCAALGLEALHRDGGQMFGVLLARSAEGEEKVLKAFSGQFAGIWQVAGWVPPVVELDRQGQMVPEQLVIEARLKELNSRIRAAEPRRRHALLRERRALSRNLMQVIRRAYRLRNGHGAKRLLTDAYLPGQGIPSGAGDCCAPKLLQECYRLGLEPMALAEFWWGAAKSKARRQGAFYGPCPDKCAPILGFMLCGTGS